MAKRFTDTDIWDQDWYIELPSKYKLLWNYIKDKCDDCGVWRPNKSLIQKIIGEPLNLQEFLEFVNVDKARIFILGNGRWFLGEFFVFQYGEKFNPVSNIHKGVLKRLFSNNINIKDIPKIDIGKLQLVDNETIKKIAYEKDNRSILIELGYHIKSIKDKE
jgi:hypothetical protein